MKPKSTGILLERDALLDHLLACPPEIVSGESRGWDGLGVAAHYHADIYQLDYFTGGRGRYEIAGHAYAIEDKTFYLSCPGDMHAIDPERSKEIRSLGIKFRLAPVGRQARSEPVRFDRVFVLDPAVREGFVGLMRTIVSRTVLGDRESMILAANGLRELLALLARIKNEGRLRVREAGAADQDVADRIWGYLKRHLAEPVRLVDLSRHVGLSRFHLARVFAANTGKSPHEALTELRLHQARNLVRETRLPFREIARQVGFKKPAYFSELFKRRYGVPPRAARARAGRDGNPLQKATAT